MNRPGSSNDSSKTCAPARRSPWPWLGPVVVFAALACALTTFLVMVEFGPLAPTSPTLYALYAADGLALVALAGMVFRQSFALFSAWRRGEAAARLHLRTVAFFSVVALAPAIVLAVVGSISLDRALNPAFLADVKVFVHNTAEAQQAVQESECGALVQEAQLTASDLDSARGLFVLDRARFHDFFLRRARVLDFSAAAVITRDNRVLDDATILGAPSAVVIAPPASEFDSVLRGDSQCLAIDNDKTFVVLRALKNFDNAFLYVTRPIDAHTLEFRAEADKLIATYDAFADFGAAVKRAFATMYALLTTIMLLSAIWVGLEFANRLVAPIRELITATDQVTAGDLGARVGVDRAHGDLARLGEGFNKMTAELDQQQKSLIEASRVNEERRAFTEAVLAGVPAAVIGVDGSGAISVVNRSAQTLLESPARENVVGLPAEQAGPELEPILRDAAEIFPRALQTQLTIKRGTAERTYSVRVTSAKGAEDRPNFVVTLDDITDLVLAQRTSAWADVARRIAHEIKNPLTPIQLSAERLKRKYGRVISVDRDVFDQCIDTIVRQVDDIKRMVDEFSSFARMPKARLQPNDLCECVRQVVFLMRVGNADTQFIEQLPAPALIANFDKRLLSQALQNILKNAVEGIAAREPQDAAEEGVVRVALTVREGEAQIDVIDNGKGFPETNRHLLLEPYMTTRAEGTGLGLPIVAKIVEDHGGRLELLDAPQGRGACVRLKFPLAPSAAEVDKVPAKLASDA
ncbi:MAG TPA: PAS domain-containing sensor histidine kinase [Methylocystis sp.]|nr:PAS domain-containing sensor histidine kinase [Methylocystis sp.]